MPLPSLPEQQRVMAGIEKLAARIEEAKELRKKTVKEAEAFSSVAIGEVLSDVSTTGHLSDVLADKPRNGWSARCDNAEDGMPILSLGAVTGYKYRETEFKRTSQPIAEGAHFWLKTGDILITRSNTPELVGHAAIYNGNPNPCIYPDLMMKLDVDEAQADKNFVHRWLCSVTVRNYIRSKAKGTSPTMKKISQGVVMNIPFPSQLALPDQHRIVSYLDSLQSKVDELKKLQSETQKELNALMPSILDKAFKGEL